MELLTYSQLAKVAVAGGGMSILLWSIIFLRERYNEKKELSKERQERAKWCEAREALLKALRLAFAYQGRSLLSEQSQTGRDYRLLASNMLKVEGKRLANLPELADLKLLPDVEKIISGIFTELNV